MRCLVRSGIGDFDLSFQFQPRVEGPSGDASWALACLLLPAMKLGEPLEIDGAVSPKLLASVPTLQDVFFSWVPGLKRIAVVANNAESRQGAGCGLFFSAGVDSFYTLIQNRSSVSALITVHGFDIPVEDEPSFGVLLDRASKVSAVCGKRMIAVKTNVRQFSDRLLSWGMYHGSAMAAVGLGSGFSRCFVASSDTYRDLQPWGSHPLTDPLWSTEGTAFVHDGCGANRMEKLAAISKEQWSLDALRVCWESNSATNCGRCEKCLRTMVGLHLIRSLTRCATLPHAIPVDAVRGLQLNKLDWMYWAEFLAFDPDPALLRAIQVALANYSLGLPPGRGSVKQVVKRMLAIARHQARPFFTAEKLVRDLPSR